MPATALAVHSDACTRPAPCPPQVPDAALSKAEALAYSEFPDEGQLPLYSSSLAAAQHRGGGGLVAAAHHRPGSCLRIARRLSSPRQFGHRPMAGACGRGGSGGAAGAGYMQQDEVVRRQASAIVCCTRTSFCLPFSYLPPHLPPSPAFCRRH